MIFSSAYLSNFGHCYMQIAMTLEYYLNYEAFVFVEIKDLLSSFLVLKFDNLVLVWMLL